MSKFLKKLTKSDRFQNLLSWIVSIYLKFVVKTSCWTWVGLEQANPYFNKGPLIVCFWHGRMALIPFMNHWPHKRIVALISGHGDGMMVAKTFKRLGIDYTNGSTNRGGARAFLALIDVLKNNNIVGIIPDGPRGPAKHLAVGIVHLSRHSKAPIMPMAFATSRYITFNSWDRFQLPLPFSKGVFIFGDPIPALETKDETEIETWRLKVQTAVSALQDTADNLLRNKE